MIKQLREKESTWNVDNRSVGEEALSFYRTRKLNISTLVSIQSHFNPFHYHLPVLCLCQKQLSPHPFPLKAV
jgi:hypothetical protein